MRVSDCIEQTKKAIFDEFSEKLNEMLEKKAPEKIALDAIVEVYINMIASINKHKVVEIFKSMDYAENYLKAYCDDFREQNGMYGEEDEINEDEDDDGEDE